MTALWVPPAVLLRTATLIIAATSLPQETLGDKPKTLVDVIPFEPSVEGIAFWLLDEALGQLNDETWDEVKQTIKDSWTQRIDPYKDDWASNRALDPFWHSGGYNLSKSDTDIKILYGYQEIGRAHV